jgi:hypothetical protein
MQAQEFVTGIDPQARHAHVVEQLTPLVTDGGKKVKLSLCLWASGCIDPRFLDVDTNCRWVVSFMLQPHYRWYPLGWRLVERWLCNIVIDLNPHFLLLRCTQTHPTLWISQSTFLIWEEFWAKFVLLISIDVLLGPHREEEKRERRKFPGVGDRLASTEYDSLRWECLTKFKFWKRKEIRKSDRPICALHVVFLGKTERKRALGWPKHRWEVNIS